METIPLPATPHATVGAFDQAVRSGLAEWVNAFIHDAARNLDRADLRNAIAFDRQHTSEVLSILRGRADALASSMVRALNEQMDEAARPPAVHAVHAPDSQTSAVTLTLIAEEQVDEDIAIAGIVQSIESEAEWELQQLVSLCNGLQQRATYAVDANPLGPALCARALRSSLASFSLSVPARTLLVRLAGAAMGQRLKTVYAGLTRLLQQWRVKPAQFQILKNVSGTARTMPPSAPGADHSSASSLPPGVRVDRRVARAPASPPQDASAARPGARPDAHGLDAAQASLERLVARAQALLDAAEPAAQRADRQADHQADQEGAAHLDLRLLAEPGDLRTGPSNALRADTAMRVMEQLFEQLSHQSSLSDGLRDLVGRLEGPALRLAATETDLWSDPKHPWWRLLDRIIAVGEVHDATAASRSGAVTASLALVVDRLDAQPGAIDRAACERAARVAEQVASRLHEDRQEEVITGLGSLQSVADREALRVELRHQIGRQLRLSPAPPGLRDFLVGPWVLAMADVAFRQGSASDALGELAQWVDDLLQACSEPGLAVSHGEQAGLLRRARLGLAQAGLPPERAQAELIRLAALLREPPPLADESWEEAQDTLPVGEAVSGFSYAALPTVPIDMSDMVGISDSGEPTRAALNRQAWIASLEPGTYCRMFMTGTWMTTQLSWVSANRNLFVFSSRHGGRTHSMTRSVLEKLRNAGLAATVAQGLLLAKAMDSVFDTNVGGM